MKDYTVQIYCEGNSSVGFGHLSRSLALYDYFLKKKLNVSIYGISKEANNFIALSPSTPDPVTVPNDAD